MHGESNRIKSNKIYLYSLGPLGPGWGPMEPRAQGLLGPMGLRGPTGLLGPMGLRGPRAQGTQGPRGPWGPESSGVSERVPIGIFYIDVYPAPPAPAIFSKKMNFYKNRFFFV